MQALWVDSDVGNEAPRRREPRKPTPCVPWIVARLRRSRWRSYDVRPGSCPSLLAWHFNVDLALGQIPENELRCARRDGAS
jgi:hypothetical protein